MCVNDVLLAGVCGPAAMKTQAMKKEKVQIPGEMNSGDKFNCAMEKAGNNIKYNTATGAVVAGTGGLMVLAKSKKTLPWAVPVDGNTAVGKFFTKVFDSVKESNVGKKAVELGSKALEYVRKNPAMFKTAAILAIPAAISIAIIKSKQIYDNGKIQQKHEDRAVLKSFQPQI